MARIRSIKPEFFTSLTIASCSEPAQRTFIGLWTYVDDEGRGVDDARLVRAAIWPLSDRPTSDIEGFVAELTEARLITRYEVDGKKYLVVRNWKEHQKIDRPSPSKLPPPPEIEASTNDQRVIDEASLPSRASAEQGKEGKGEDQEQIKEPSGAVAPVVAEVVVGTKVIPMPPPDDDDADLGDMIPDLDRIPERLTTQQLVGAWIKRQRRRPPGPVIATQGAAAKRLVANYTGPELAVAFVGISSMFPHAGKTGTPWDLFDLEKKFGKALEAAANHPEVRRRRDEAEFDQILNAGGAG